MKLWIFGLALACVLSMRSPFPAKCGESEQNQRELKRYAQSAVLMDGRTGRVLYGKNQDQEMCIRDRKTAASEKKTAVKTTAAKKPAARKPAAAKKAVQEPEATVTIQYAGRQIVAKEVLEAAKKAYAQLRQGSEKMCIRDSYYSQNSPEEVFKYLYRGYEAVSYTHLDVYKRQPRKSKSGERKSGSCPLSAGSRTEYFKGKRRRVRQQPVK